MSKTKATAASPVASISPEDAADSALARRVTFARDPSDARICVADGMGLAIRVERGALAVEDGMGEHRRFRRFDKATHGLSRLVVLSTYGGFVSLDALRWLNGLGIGTFVLAGDGSPLLSSTPKMTDDARLRRMQARAPELPIGLEIARFLIARKLSGQAGVLRFRFDDEVGGGDLDELAGAAEMADDLDELRGIEATGASLYWQAWIGRPEAAPHFAAKDRARIPKHWRGFEGRRSVLASANGNRKAERPANALLSYAYGLLEAEAILACHAMGLDPGLGFVHLDSRNRQSLALDIMEPVRAEVDAFVLDMLGTRTFRKAEFTETADGHVRLKAPLTHELAQSVPLWSRAVAPYAEQVAHALGEAMAGDYKAHTPLTRSRSRAAAAKVKARKAIMTHVAESTVSRQRPTGRRRQAGWSCPDCGAPVSDRHRVRCDACIANDARQTPSLRAARAAAISRRRQTEAAWSERGANSIDPDYFASVIQPALASMKLSAIMEACGVAKGTASDWRTGRWRPHPSHWARLAQLVEANP